MCHDVCNWLNFWDSLITFQSHHTSPKSLSPAEYISVAVLFKNIPSILCIATGFKIEKLYSMIITSNYRVQLMPVFYNIIQQRINISIYYVPITNTLLKYITLNYELTTFSSFFHYNVKKFNYDFFWEYEFMSCNESLFAQITNILYFHFEKNISNRNNQKQRV